MVRVICVILTFIMLFSPGCSKKEQPKSNDSNKVQVQNKKDNKIDKTAAKALMENYMSYILKGDIDAAKSFYSEEIKSQFKSIPVAANSRPVGYKIESGENDEESGESSGSSDNEADFSVHIYRSSIGLPYFSDDTYKYTVKMQENKMAIEKMERKKSTELYEKDRVLYKREGDNIKGEEIIALKDMADYISLSSTPAPGQKIPTPKDVFGPCALSPDEKKLLITTMGSPRAGEKLTTPVYALPEPAVSLSYVGTIEISGGNQQGEEQSIKQKSETKQTLSLEGGMGGGKQEEEGGGQEKQGGAGQEKTAEKKAVLSMKSIAVYEGAKIQMVSFSPDSKVILVQLLPPAGLNRIHLYKCENGEEIKLIIDKQFPADRFAIDLPYFASPNEIMFTVTPAADATDEEKRFKGVWQLDIKDGKLKQM